MIAPFESRIVTSFVALSTPLRSSMPISSCGRMPIVSTPTSRFFGSNTGRANCMKYAPVVRDCSGPSTTKSRFAIASLK